jgi:hypothetical protein
MCPQTPRKFWGHCRNHHGFFHRQEIVARWIGGGLWWSLVVCGGLVVVWGRIGLVSRGGVRGGLGPSKERLGMVQGWSQGGSEGWERTDTGLASSTQRVVCEFAGIYAPVFLMHAHEKCRETCISNLAVSIHLLLKDPYAHIHRYTYI